MKEDQILTEITETCEHCNFSNRCLEEDCTLWRIEQIVVNQEDASEMSKLRVLELFGGIGACSKALERLGIDYEIADYVEIDKYAVRSFNAMHNTNFPIQDVTTWDKDIKVDLLMHGSPCQDFSLSGLQAGGDEGSGTRSSLMYETIRIVQKIKPKYVVWENVKNLLSKKHIHNFNNYLNKMSEIGYINYYQVLNAKDYGIPQNRERVFTISIRKDIDKGFVFPQPQELKLRLKDMLEDEVDEKYYLSDEIVKKYIPSNESENTNVIGNLVMNKWQEHMKRIYDVNKYSPAINTMQGGNLEPKILCLNSKGGRNGVEGLQPSLKDRIYDSNGIATCCATSNFFMPNYTDGLRIRKLTPKECYRLMGFDDEDFEKAAKVNSNAQLYKQAGNSIVVNVLEAILTNLLLEQDTQQERQTTIYDYV